MNATGGEQISLGADPGALDRIARDGGGEVGQFVLVAELGFLPGGVKIMTLPQLLLLGQDGHHDEPALVHELLLVLLVEIHLDAALAVQRLVVVGAAATADVLVAVSHRAADDADGVGDVGRALRPVNGGAPEGGDLFPIHVGQAWDAPLLDGWGEGYGSGAGRDTCRRRRVHLCLGLLIIIDACICVMSDMRRRGLRSVVVIELMIGVIVTNGVGEGRASSPVDPPLRSDQDTGKRGSCARSRRTHGGCCYAVGA